MRTPIQGARPFSEHLPSYLQAIAKVPTCNAPLLIFSLPQPFHLFVLVLIYHEPLRMWQELSVDACPAPVNPPFLLECRALPKKAADHDIVLI